jgi:hypothetical protein
MRFSSANTRFNLANTRFSSEKTILKWKTP